MKPTMVANAKSSLRIFTGPSSYFLSVHCSKSAERSAIRRALREPLSTGLLVPGYAQCKTNVHEGSRNRHELRDARIESLGALALDVQPDGAAVGERSGGNGPRRPRLGRGGLERRSQGLLGHPVAVS